MPTERSSFTALVRPDEIDKLQAKINSVKYVSQTNNALHIAKSKTLAGVLEKLQVEVDNKKLECKDVIEKFIESENQLSYLQTVKNTVPDYALNRPSTFTSLSSLDIEQRTFRKSPTMKSRKLFAIKRQQTMACVKLIPIGDEDEDDNSYMLKSSNKSKDLAVREGFLSVRIGK